MISPATLIGTAKAPAHWGWLRLAAVTLFALALAACDGPSQPLNVGTNNWPGYEPLYLAESRGFVSSKDMRLVQYPSASEVIRGFQNGTISAAAVTLDEALLLQSQGMPVRLVLVLDASNGADVIVSRPEFQSFDDIVGRKVGMESGALGAFVFCRAAELHGRHCSSDFSIVNLEVNEHEKAYVAGEVDAVVTFEPVRSRLIDKGARLLFDSSEIPYEVLDVLVVSEETARERPEKVRAIVAGWFRSLDYMNENFDEATEIMSRRGYQSAQELRDSYERVKLLGREENLRLFGGETPEILKYVANLHALMVQQKLLRESTQSPISVDGSFLEATAE